MGWIPSPDWEFEVPSIWFVSESSEGIHPMFLPQHIESEGEGECGELNCTETINIEWEG